MGAYTKERSRNVRRWKESCWIICSCSKKQTSFHHRQLMSALRFRDELKMQLHSVCLKVGEMTFIHAIPAGQNGYQAMKWLYLKQNKSKENPRHAVVDFLL